MYFSIKILVNALMAVGKVRLANMYENGNLITFTMNTNHINMENTKDKEIKITAVQIIKPGLYPLMYQVPGSNTK